MNAFIPRRNSKHSGNARAVVAIFIAAQNFTEHIMSGDNEKGLHIGAADFLCASCLLRLTRMASSSPIG